MTNVNSRALLSWYLPMVNGIPGPFWRNTDLCEDIWRVNVQENGAQWLQEVTSYVEESGLNLCDLASAPSIKALPADLSKTLLNRLASQGFVVLSGLCDLPCEEMKTVAVVISRGLGDILPSPETGIYTEGPVYAVTDRGLDVRSGNVLFSNTREPIGIHTDGTSPDFVPDVVALLCVHPALNGGVSRIVNVNFVHERIRNRNPKALALLYRDFFRSKIRVGKNAPPTYEERFEQRYPIFEFGRWQPCLTFRYTREWVVRGHDEIGEPLNQRELEAIDLLEEELNAPDMVFEVSLQSGELLLLNNHWIGHDRTRFSDGVKKRLLYRIWIKQRKEAS